MSPGSKRLRLAAVSLALLIVDSSLLNAQTADELVRSKHVMIRHRVEPAEPAYVGQPVKLHIEVLTRTWYLQAPRFPTDLEVRSTIVVPPEAFAVNSSERIDGQNYAVQSRAYTLFPQTPGRFEVPPVEVTLVVALDDASRSPEIRLRTDPVSIEARLPSGAQGRGLVLSTPGLDVEESYSRSTEGLRVGDSFERTVSMTIENSVGMLLPPITFESAEGIAIYPDRPEVSDERNRGSFTGSRKDSVTYVMEREGDYRLPEVTFWWWNLRSSTLVEESLPEVSFTVAPNPDLAAEHLSAPDEIDEQTTPEAEEKGKRKTWLITLVAVVLGGLVTRLLRRRARTSGAPHLVSGPSESELYRKFEEAAKSKNSARTYQAMMRWLDAFDPINLPATMRAFVSVAEDPELAHQTGALEDKLFSSDRSNDSSSWTDRTLVAAVSRARKRLAASRTLSGSAASALPSINPSR